MSKIFELFGFPLETWNSRAKINAKKAFCPFMGAQCDGGGNRYLSGINLEQRTDLQKYFPGLKLVQAGVCSLRPKVDEQPWIVCPRRLLSLRNGKANFQSTTLSKLIHISGLQKDAVFRAWSEVKMKVETANEEEEAKSFDYTFDYILTGLTRKPLAQIAALIEKSERITQDIAEKNGFTLARRDGVLWVDDFPSDPITIVEIMTSSTSGGDKKKRTQIAMAFEDAIKKGSEHNGPGINYRQVWARMVSQLIVKSQVGMAWKGKTIWLLQDVLANYISQSTALNLERYVSEQPNEVNILAFGYGSKADTKTHQQQIIELTHSIFYSGPISDTKAKSAGFIDIIKIGAPPPKEKLWKALFLKKPCASLQP
jgi:hypothetical protein